MNHMLTHALRASSSRVVLGLLCLELALVMNPGIAPAQQPQKSVRTQLELQSELMGFADRFHEFLAQASFDPAFRDTPELFGDHLAIVLAAFTIAAAPNPAVSLLDLIVLTTLERIIYEEHWSKQHGDLVRPYAAAFRNLEADIWAIAANVLTPTEQKDLRALIRTWRRTHPQQVYVAFVRFSDFAQERQTFTVAETQKARGLFKSVQQATQKVEDVRLLAERGIYLATRMLLIAGPVGEAWLTTWLRQPDLTRLRRDVSQVSASVERTVLQVEQLPTHVRQERQAAIRQLMDRVDAALNLLMDRVSHERQQLMVDLASQEEGGRGVLTGIQQMLVAGTAFATSAQGAVQALDDFTSRMDARLIAAGKQPADVTDVRGLMVDVSSSAQHLGRLVVELDAFLRSPAWEQHLAQLIQVLNRVEAEGEGIIAFTLKQAFVYGLLLLLGFLITVVLAGGILIRYASSRLARAPAMPRTP